MSFEQAHFKAMLALAQADTGAGGLFESGGANRLYGGFVRSDQQPPPETHNLPRVEVTFLPAVRNDSADGRGESVVVRMAVKIRRDNAFGTGDTPENAGVVDGIMDRLEAVYHGASLSATGWSPAVMSVLRSPFQGPSDRAVVTRIMECLLVSSPS